MDTVRLHHGDARLVVDPQHGGALRRYSWRGLEILRPTAPDAGGDPLQLASFPLVPYANRIVHGRFQQGAHAVQLRPNWSGDPHPLHGQGWRRLWAVKEASFSTATLQLEGGGDEWPWEYRAEQYFRLEPQALLIRLSVENLSSEPMPAMLGLHPYFPDAANARLQARCPRVWTTDAGALPIEEVPTPDTWSFAQGRPVAPVPLDHCFAGWDGTAVMSWPDRTVTLRAVSCTHLHVYVPPTGGFFCVEPQTAATGAFNRGEGEYQLLPPGGRLAMEMTLTLGVA